MLFEGNNEAYDVGTLYICSLYWALSVMTNLKGREAHENRGCFHHSPLIIDPLGERIYAIVTFIIGAVFYSVMYGNINQWVQGLYAPGARYRSRMEEIHRFAHHHHISKELRRKIVKHAEFAYLTTQGINSDSIAAELPAHMRLELYVQLNKRLVQRVRIFDGCTDDFYQAIGMKPKPFGGGGQSGVIGSVSFHQAIVVKPKPGGGGSSRVFRSFFLSSGDRREAETFCGGVGGHHGSGSSRVGAITDHLVVCFSPQAIVMKLKPSICVGGDYVCYEGEAAENMYFIKQGILQVIKDGRVVYTFEEGGYFGEIALLCDQPRSADVRALTDCMLLSLSCDSLWEVWFCSFELNFGHMAKVGLRHFGRD